MRRSSLASAAVLAALLSPAACDDGTSPGLPPLELRVDAPSPSTLVHPLDDIVLVGEATASDVGLLHADSIWWTDNGVEVGRGRSVVRRRVTAGVHDYVFHARYGPRRDSVAVRVATDGEGIGRVLWATPLDTVGSPALSMGPGGVLYALERGDAGTGWRLAAVGPDGGVRWRTSLDVQVDFSFPAVGPDGTVYVGYHYGPGSDGGLIAVAPDGGRRWVFQPEHHGPAGSTYYHVHGSPAVGADGTIYVASEENDRPIYAVNPDGSLRWRAPTAATPCGGCNRLQGPVAIAGDSLVVTVRRGGQVLAVAAASGEFRWAVQVSSGGGGITNGTFAPLSVDAGGDVYAHVWDELARIRPSGTVAWRRPFMRAQISGSPPIGNGRMYFASGAGVRVRDLQGESEPSLGTVGPEPGAGGVITLARNGVLYIASTDSLYSVDNAGARRFALAIRNAPPIPALPFPVSGPVVGADGTVYVRAAQFGVIAVRDTVGPATDAPWPTAQGGFARAGRRTPP